MLRECVWLAFRGMTAQLRTEYELVLVGEGGSWMAVQTECLHDPLRGSWRYFPSQGDSGTASCTRQRTPTACGVAALGETRISALTFEFAAIFDLAVLMPVRG
jgi:hypothetical protein